MACPDIVAAMATPQILAGIRFHGEEGARLHARICALAEQEGRSMNMQMLQMLRDQATGRGRGMCVLLTGPAGPERLAIAQRMARITPHVALIAEEQLHDQLFPAGRTAEDRAAHRLYARVAALCARHIVAFGGTALCSLTAPYADDRAELVAWLAPDPVRLVLVDTHRRPGEPYEVPDDPDLHILQGTPVTVAVDRVIAMVNG